MFEVSPLSSSLWVSHHNGRRNLSMDSSVGRRLQIPQWAGAIKNRKCRNSTTVMSKREPLSFAVGGCTGARSHGSHSHDDSEVLKWFKKVVRKLKGEKDTDEDEHHHDHGAGKGSAIEKKFHNYKLEAKEAKNQAKQIQLVTYIGLVLNLGLGGAKYFAGVVRILGITILLSRN